MKYIWIFLLILFVPYAWAGETDFADYEVGRWYHTENKWCYVTWISEDKREIRFICEIVEKEKLSHEEQYYKNKNEEFEKGGD